MQSYVKEFNPRKVKTYIICILYTLSENGILKHYPPTVFQYGSILFVKHFIEFEPFAVY